MQYKFGGICSELMKVVLMNRIKSIYLPFFLQKNKQNICILCHPKKLISQNITQAL